MISARLLWAPWIASILGLSFYSGYSVHAVGSMNLAIATMLTPIGIFFSWLSGPEYYLRPYYFVPTRMRPELWGSGVVVACWLVFAVSSAGLLVGLRRSLR